MMKTNDLINPADFGLIEVHRTEKAVCFEMPLKLKTKTFKTIETNSGAKQEYLFQIWVPISRIIDNQFPLWLLGSNLKSCSRAIV